MFHTTFSFAVKEKKSKFAEDFMIYHMIIFYDVSQEDIKKENHIA